MSPLQAPSRAGAGLQLPLLAEPAGLKRATRVMAEEEPDRAAALLTEPDWVAAHLWDGWGPELETAAIDRDAFLTILTGYRLELWYWVWGHRTWAHCTQGLAGRLARRARHQESDQRSEATETAEGG